MNGPCARLAGVLTMVLGELADVPSARQATIVLVSFNLQERSLGLSFMLEFVGPIPRIQSHGLELLGH